MKHLGQEQAFPTEQSNMSNGFETLGMSKRFYAACAAMQGMLANSNENLVYTDVQKMITESYKCADELLKQEQL